MNLFQAKIEIPSADEDSVPYADEHMLVVCDGLGAAGQNKHEIDGKNYTSAYLGSRIVSGFTVDYFNKYQEDIWIKKTEEVFLQFKEALHQELQKQIQDLGLRKYIKGKASELLPTTLAAAFYKEKEDFIDIYAVWAGDSRVYILSSKNGLQQITEDNVEDEFDALQSLGNSNMSNDINGEGLDHFWIHYARYRISKQPNLFLFACSDGCFDYLDSPMDFEYLLELAMQSMEDSASLSTYGESLAQFYGGSNLHDDTTVAGVVFDGTSAESLKTQYFERFSYVTETFRNPTAEISAKIEALNLENEKNLIQVSRGIRDISRELLPYFGRILSTDIMPNEQQNLKDILLALPSLQTVVDSFKRINEKKEELQLQINELSEKRTQLLNELWESFVEEYPAYYVHNVKTGGKGFGFRKTPLDCCVAEYRRVENEKSYGQKQIISILNDLESLLPGLRIEIENGSSEFTARCREISKLSKELLQYRDIVCDDNGYSEREQEKRMYQIRMQLLENGGMKQEFYNSVGNGFQKYVRCPEFSELFEYVRKFKECDRQIETLQNEQNLLGKTLNWENAVKAAGNNLLYELFGVPNFLELIPENNRETVREYVTLKSEQDKNKQKVVEEERRLFELWREYYKENYELYRRKNGGGVV